MPGLWNYVETMNPSRLSFHQKSILIAMEFIDSWQRWIDQECSGPIRSLHVMMIRASKGMIKAWRGYLAEVTAEPESDTKPIIGNHDERYGKFRKSTQD